MLGMWAGASRNDVHEWDAKGCGGQLVSLTVELLAEALLIPIHEWLDAPLHYLCQQLHALLWTRTQAHCVMALRFQKLSQRPRIAK